MDRPTHGSRLYDHSEHGFMPVSSAHYACNHPDDPWGALAYDVGCRAAFAAGIAAVTTTLTYFCGGDRYHPIDVDAPEFRAWRDRVAAERQQQHVSRPI